jgi:hypothetical protein
MSHFLLRWLFPLSSKSHSPERFKFITLSVFIQYLTETSPYSWTSLNTHITTVNVMVLYKTKTKQNTTQHNTTQYCSHSRNGSNQWRMTLVCDSCTPLSYDEYESYSTHTHARTHTHKTHCEIWHSHSSVEASSIVGHDIMSIHKYFLTFWRSMQLSCRVINQVSHPKRLESSTEIPNIKLNAK